MEKSPRKKEKLTPEQRFKMLQDSRSFERRVLELLSEEERKEVEELKRKLGWEELPYKNLKELIKWANHIENDSDESKELLTLIVNKVYDEVFEIERKQPSYWTSFYKQSLLNILTRYPKSTPSNQVDRETK